MLIASTLRLDADKQTINYITAWSIGQPSKSSATVSVLNHKGKIYFLTNAHAIVNATYLKVKFNKDATELPVKTVWVDPIMDVAIVEATTAEAKDLIEKRTKSLTINTQFQPAATEVSAYGYPTGGKSLSFTKGHISRTEVTTVAHSQLPGITVQTSAPINPGNSGGPITIVGDSKEEECIGIVSQNYSSLSNVGYFIPACILVQTIENYEKYKKVRASGFINYVTVPNVDFKWQSLKNVALRSHLGLEPVTLEEELIGIYVSKVPESSCAFKVLQAGDVILKIDGHQIQSDGNVIVQELEHPISYLYIIQRKKYLDTIKFTIQRKNEQGQLQTQEISFKLNQQLGQSLLGPIEDNPLKYHIQPSGKNGAFVFVRCTRSLMNTFKQNYTSGTKSIVDKSNYPLIFEEFDQLSKSKDLHEVVVLQNILATEETDGYERFALSSGSQCESHRVNKVNNIPIKNLWELISILSENSNKPAEIQFDNGKILIIAPEVEKNTRENLKSRYQIAFFTSPKVAPISRQPFLDELNALRSEEGNAIPSKMKCKA